MFEASSSYNNGRPESSSTNGQGGQDKYLSKNKTAAGVPLPSPTPNLSIFDPFVLSSYPGAFPNFNPAFMGHHPPPHPPTPALNGGGLFGGNPMFAPFAAPNYLDHQQQPHSPHPTVNNSFNGFHHTQSLVGTTNHHSYPNSIYSDTNGLANFTSNKNLAEPSQHHHKQHRNEVETTANREISFSEHLKLLRQSLQSKPINPKEKCECHRGKCSLHQVSSQQSSIDRKSIEQNNQQSNQCSFIKKEFDDDSYCLKPKEINQNNQQQKSVEQNNSNEKVLESPIKAATTEQTEQIRSETPEKNEKDANVSVPESVIEEDKQAPKSVDPAVNEDKTASKKVVSLY